MLAKGFEKRITVIFLFFIIPGVVYFTLKESLKLALIGDDWLLLYTIRQIFEVQKSISYFNPHTYLCTYCPPYFYLSIIKHLWGYDPFYYYLISLITRIFAAMGVFFVTKAFTKRLLPAILASTFFSVSYIGIQTTDWVFNLNHYVGVGLACFFLTIYIKAKEQGKIKFLFLSNALFASTLIVSPPRMHGLFPLVLAMELGWFLIDRQNFILKRSVIRIITLLLTYRVVFSSGGYGTGGYLETILDNLSSLPKNSVHLIASIGNYVFPDMLYKNIPFEKLSLFGKEPLTFFSFIFPIGGVLLIVGLFVLFITKSKSSSIFLFTITCLFTMISLRFAKRSDSNFFTPEKIAYILTGGAALLLTLFLFLNVRRRKKYLAHSLAMGIAWMLLFSIFPWLLAPYSFLNSWSRYSVQQAAGLSLWMATIFTLLLDRLYQNKKSSLLVVVAILGFLMLHISYTRAFIDNLVAHRSEVKVQRLWDKLTKDVPSIDKYTNSIFYLSYDDYFLAEWGLRFGFSSRAAIQYDITNQNNNPFMIYEYEDVLSIARDGEAFKKQIGKPKQIPLENIYGFELKEGSLINTTPTLRARISKDLTLQRN